MTLDFGKMVREARERRGWSQEQLAEKVGATQSTIDRIESGSTRRSRYMHYIAVELDLVKYAADDRDERPIKKQAGGIQEKTLSLPVDIIERVRKYRIDYDVPSEEEAYRQLINEGLMHFDHFQSITDRLHKRLKEKGSLRDAARYVLGSHPLIQSITYKEKSVRFVMTDRFTVEMNDEGIATVLDESGDYYEFAIGDETDWAAPENLDPPQKELREDPDTE